MRCAAEAEQLVQAGYQILAGDAPRENDDFARQFKSKDVSARPPLLVPTLQGFVHLGPHLQPAAACLHMLEASTSSSSTLAHAMPFGGKTAVLTLQRLQMRKVAGALEELFESVAKRGKALRAANPTTFQMDLTVAVANEVSRPCSGVGLPPGSHQNLS